MPVNFEYDFSSHVGSWKGKSNFSTGLYIDGKFVDGVEQKTIEYVPPQSSYYP